MSEPPQIQTILTSKNVSDEHAKQILSKFLVEQRKYFEDAETDGAPNSNIADEDQFDMDDGDNIGTYAELEARVSGIIRSLSGIKRPKVTVATIVEKETPPTPESQIESDSDSIQSPEPKNMKSGDVAIKEESFPNEESPSDIAKSDKKAKKKAAKEARKEAKREAKKVEKEAKKAKKKAEKEAKKLAKKDKKQRKADD